MTATTDFGPLEELDEATVPVLRTPVPGPRSHEAWERDARHHAGNSSPPSQLLRLVLADGHGALVRDVDGNVYINLRLVDGDGLVAARAWFWPQVAGVARRSARLDRDEVVLLVPADGARVVVGGHPETLQWFGDRFQDS
ncbi:MAG: hypothetical protein M3R71_01120 [Actinomycetota bacterium]|nr:hypothetical protein [Actinomycetota bacterium]